MIIREWRCRTMRSEAEKFPEYFRREIAPGMRDTPGFMGAFLSQRPTGEYMEFVVLTLWKSMDAILAFAGVAPENPVIDMVAMATVVTYDDKVRHYEVLEDLWPKES
jgi:heme-degrading monooxygenase HmoA